MIDLDSIVIFAKVVQAKSFSAAARSLKMPISTVSRRIADLEGELGVRLLERSTRSLRLTEIGAEVFAQAQRGAELREAVEAIVANQLREVQGRLRLSASPSLADSLIAPLVAGFQASHPSVQIQILLTDRIVDHIAEGVDLAVRVGALKDSSLVAKKMLSYRHQLVASPQYVRACPNLKSPQDLLRFRLVAFSQWLPEVNWNFVHVKTGLSETVSFQPHLSMNDYAGSATFLAEGAGIGDLPPVVQPELMRSGQLVEVLPDWRFKAMDLSLVHLSNRHVSRPVRLFKEFANRMVPTLFPALPV